MKSHANRHLGATFAVNLAERRTILIAKIFARLMLLGCRDVPLFFERRRPAESLFRGPPPSLKSTNHSVGTFVSIAIRPAFPCMVCTRVSQ